MDATTYNKGKKTRKNSPLNSEVNLDSLVYGKMPPQARKAEESILGAILVEKDAFDRAAALLRPEMFYVDAHQRIYTAMTALYNRNQPIDTVTVSEELAKTDPLETIGGPFFLSQLTNAVVSGANVESHARIVVEKYIKREQIRICAQALSAAFEETTDAFECMDFLQANLNKISISRSGSEVSHISASLIERFRRLEELRHREDHLTGVPTGFRPLDLLTAGWQNTDLIIIAARPSVGKTAFALNLGRNAALHPTKPTPVAIFSLEMSVGQLNDRMMSAESGIDLDLITRARMSDELMQKLYRTGLQPLGQAPLYIDDTPGLHIMELRAKARKLKKENDIGLIILDYLQLMTADESKPREQQIALISRSLKGLAKELNVPIIALSQLSREVEKAKRDPQLSDLRESGAIEQDADMVMFLTRPDYQEYSDRGGEGDNVQGMADIHIKKHRNGDLAKIPMRTELKIQRWMSNDQYEQYQRNLSYPHLKPLKTVNGEYQEDTPF